MSIRLNKRELLEIRKSIFSVAENLDLKIWHCCYNQGEGCIVIEICDTAMNWEVYLNLVSHWSFTVGEIEDLFLKNIIAD